MYPLTLKEMTNIFEFEKGYIGLLFIVIESCSNIQCFSMVNGNNVETRERFDIKL